MKISKKRKMENGVEKNDAKIGEFEYSLQLIQKNVSEKDLEILKLEKRGGVVLSTYFGHISVISSRVGVVS